MSQPRRRLYGTVLFVLVLGMAATYYVFGSSLREVHASGIFERANGLYPGDDVRILGVSVGKVDQVTPQGTDVKIDFHYDHGYRVPSNAMAAIVAPSLVSGRYIQLAPAYLGGPVMSDGATIPLERTAVPVEWDQIQTELTSLAHALGPNGVNAHGALNSAVTGTAQFFNGNGAQLAATLDAAAKTADSLSNDSGNLFMTVRNLNNFVQALNSSDSQIRTFSNELASISALLDENKTKLTTLLKQADTALTTTTTFVNQNRARLDTSVSSLEQVTHDLAGIRVQLANLLHLGPTTLANVYNIYNPTDASLTGRLELPYTGALSSVICQSIFSLGGTLDDCRTALGPVVNELNIQDLPVTADPLNQAGTPNQRDPGQPDPATGYSKFGSEQANAPSVPSLGGLLLPGSGG
ncbi:MAG: phospholipid/cholesterol/gamma-HCH transport system substrate-binding protein [Pseudonocardiales bacterium]|nr:phospholipid/cholesterol/gamma-HCH transport system substrate-binding protein [Pseudonocardiales bacterium]